MTPEERKRLAKKWSKVLDMDIGKPITDPNEAKILSYLIESQVKLNENFMKSVDKQS